jgi:hypothetical protein
MASHAANAPHSNIAAELLAQRVTHICVRCVTMVAS